MCGIVGYTGFRNAQEIVVEGLKTLEYRGYDSAGIALENQKIEVFKSLGRVSELAKILPYAKSCTAIGHTRWATHGVPLVKNAHPHLSFDGKIAVVHNGIIENFKNLKSDLQTRGIPFVSDTDSEIIAHLLALDASENFLERVENVAKMLKGSATFLAIRENDENIYCAKNGASLAVGNRNGESFVTSDTLAVCSYLDKITPLQDGDIAVLSKNDIKIFNSLKRVQRKSYAIERTLPKECDCFMSNEINDIPKAVLDTANLFLANENPLAEQRIKEAKRLFFVGCGTAYHACLYGKRVFSLLTDKVCEAVESSEFDEGLLSDKSVAIFISQSGETLDTVLAAKKCIERGIFSIAICNVRGSLLHITADSTYFLEAGAEIAVAATKSYVCQLTLLFLLAKRCVSAQLSEDFVQKLANCLEYAQDATLSVQPTIKKKIFFIGKGLDVITAKEAALKVKEVTYKMTDAYPAGELKHGPIALIDKDSVAVVIVTNSDDYGRIEATISELKSRGAYVVQVGNVKNLGADEFVYVKTPKDKLLSPIVTILPLQRFALDLSVALGLNPDKPRNLAKSVTVI